MAQPTGKRSTIKLYIKENDPYSYRILIVLEEKGIKAEIISISPEQSAEETAELKQHNPYGSVPILMDRDLILFETKIITEYLDERYPHPPLLPVYPVARAQKRQIIYRIERDWYPLLKEIENDLKNDKVKDQKPISQKALEDSLKQVSPIFAGKSYFMSDEFTLVDCCITSLLCHLDKLYSGKNVGFSVPSNIEKYKKELFLRPSIKAALGEVKCGVKT